MMRLLLVFPMSVVVLAFVSFVFGGHCAAWQWWAATAVALASGFWRSTAKEGIRNGALFLGWLALFWTGCAMIAGAAWFDEVAYQYSAVRMLVDGWNPLRDCTPAAALGAVGLGADDLWIDHVIYMPKVVWVFDAVAWFFTDDVLNPLAPILWFLFPAVVGRAWRSMEGVHIVWKLLAVPLLYCIVPNTAYCVDSVVALSAIGLLLTFEEILSRRGFDPLSLIVFSFWMMGAKTPGLLHGGFFWIVFIVFLLCTRRKDVALRLSATVGIVAMLLALSCATPYLTSIRDYGHPFYPKYSIDEKRFPVKDLTHDFVTRRNEDAAQMGYAGLYVNAFISPSLAREYYRRKLDKPDFMPYSQPYTHYPNDGGSSHPLRRSMRILFWLSLAWLFLGAGKSWRMPALGVLLCMGAAPPPMLGYFRYIPWWISVALFAYIDCARRPEKWSRRVLCAAFLLLTCSVRPHTLTDRLVYATSLVERRGILARLFEGDDEPPAIRPAISPGMGQLKMLFRHAPYMKRPELLPYSRDHQVTTGRERLEISALMFVFDDLDEMRRRAFRYPEGTLHRAAYLAHIYLGTLPRLAAARIASLWRDDDKGAL